jgi:hypothetical protein
MAFDYATKKPTLIMISRKFVGECISCFQSKHFGCYPFEDDGEVETAVTRCLVTQDTNIFFFSMVRQPLVSLGLLIVEASRSHSDTPHSVGLLWTSDQSDAETCI